ncbi:MAG TPA: alpha/beta hydrolase [Nitriliruptoraceae bacterium]|nr:alpha/beta hydrolase [Nitriliruptoraceae bacterium]
MSPTLGNVRRITYGSAPDQFADLRLPSGVDGPAPVAIVVHGGFWRSHRGLDMVAPLAEDLARRGWATYNLEYGRVGGRGGWPTTLTDVAAGVDALAGLVADEPLDLDRVLAIGHSAGGHLALWAAARPHLPTGVPGAGPRVVPAAVVSLAGVADLRAAAADDLGEGAAVEFLGGTPDEVDDRYDVASPADHLPLGVPQLLAHGDADEHVPLSHARAHRDAALAAGDDVTLLEFPGADHFPVIEPTSRVWSAIVEHLPEV